LPSASARRGSRPSPWRERLLAPPPPPPSPRAAARDAAAQLASPPRTTDHVVCGAPWTDQSAVLRWTLTCTLGCGRQRSSQT
jgi:hypothetical protein